MSFATALYFRGFHPSPQVSQELMLQRGPTKRPIARVSLADTVYQRLYEDILTGRIPGGTELNEVNVSSQFEVSRTPVREALRRLVSAGLLTVLRNRRTVVVQMSRKDIQETFEVRQLLEARAARLAAGRVPVERLTELRRLARQSEPRDDPLWQEAERAFDAALHQAVADSCGNDRLRQEILRYDTIIRLVRQRANRNLRHLQTSHHEHLAILAALEVGDPAAAEVAMAHHIDVAMQTILDELRSEPL
jgi:DNA-binding GntR family transcriptional regulator